MGGAGSGGAALLTCEPGWFAGVAGRSTSTFWSMGSVWEMWKTVVVFGRRLATVFSSPVLGSFSVLTLPRTGTQEVILTPCSPLRTRLPLAFHAKNVKTLTRGVISLAGMPFCMNPSMMGA